MNWKILNSLELAYKPNSPNLFGIDDAIMIPSLISAGTSIVGGLFGQSSQRSANNANLQAVRETNEANLRLYREQYADQYKLWQENNSYNDPSAQMQRLRNAGLNPALLMQNGGAGTASAASVPSAAPMQAGQVDPVPPAFNASDIANTLSMLGSGLNQATQARGNQISNTFMSRIKQQELAQSIAQTELLKQQTKKGSMEYSLLESQLTMQKLQYRLFSETYDQQKQSFQLSNDLTSANASLARQQEKSARAQELFTNVQTQLAGIDLKYKERNMQLAIQQFIQEIALLGSQYRVNEETAKNIWQKTLTEQQVTKGQENQNKLFDETLPYVLEQAELQNDLIEEQIHASRYGRSGFKIGPLDVKEYNTRSPFTPTYKRPKHGSGFTSEW